MTNMPHSRIQVARLGECWILIGNSGNLIQHHTIQCVLIQERTECPEQ